MEQTQKTLTELEDERLDALHSSILNLKDMAGATGVELQGQGETIVDIDAHVDKTNSKIITGTRNINNIIKKNSRCTNTILYGIMLLLVIGILAVSLTWK